MILIRSFSIFVQSHVHLLLLFAHHRSSCFYSFYIYVRTCMYIYGTGLQPVDFCCLLLYSDSIVIFIFCTSSYMAKEGGSLNRRATASTWPDLFIFADILVSTSGKERAHTARQRTKRSISISISISIYLFYLFSSSMSMEGRRKRRRALPFCQLVDPVDIFVVDLCPAVFCVHGREHLAITCRTCWCWIDLLDLLLYT